MSAETFMACAYPVPAQECPIEHAVQHGLHKWEQLSPQMLAAHGVLRIDMYIVDKERRGDISAIDGTTCALCVHYWSNTNRCRKCPGAIANGNPCGEEWSIFVDTGDTAPMLEWLRKALP